jgi:hypothetical protein
MEDFLQAGDRVGIMDEADYRHWSRFGAVTGGAVGGAYPVQEDGHAMPVPVPVEKLVKLGPADENGAPGEWSVQVFPVDGERPGLPMYFRNSSDVRDFVRLFFGANLSDEKLHVRAPSSASAEDRAALKNAAGVDLV